MASLSSGQIFILPIPLKIQLLNRFKLSSLKTGEVFVVEKIYAQRLCASYDSWQQFIDFHRGDFFILPYYSDTYKEIREGKFLVRRFKILEEVTDIELVTLKINQELNEVE